jgi:hypothetical protein
MFDTCGKNLLKSQATFLQGRPCRKLRQNLRVRHLCTSSVRYRGRQSCPTQKDCSGRRNKNRTSERCPHTWTRFEYFGIRGSATVKLQIGFRSAASMWTTMRFIERSQKVCPTTTRTWKINATRRTPNKRPGAIHNAVTFHNSLPASLASKRPSTRHLPFGYLVGPNSNAERVPANRSTRRKQECFLK